MTTIEFEIPQSQEPQTQRFGEDDDYGTDEEPSKSTSAIVCDSIQSGTSVPSSQPTQLNAETIDAGWAVITNVQQQRLSIPNHPSFSRTLLHKQLGKIVWELTATHMGLNVETSKKGGTTLGNNLQELYELYMEMFKACPELSSSIADSRQRGSILTEVHQNSPSQVDVMRSTISGALSALLLLRENPRYLSPERIRRKEEKLKRRERKVKRREREVSDREDNERLLRPITRHITGEEEVGRA